MEYQKRTQAARRLAAPIGILLASTAFSTVHAQDMLDEQAAKVSDIVVTGSRIARRDYAATSPIATLSETILEQSGSTAIDTSLKEMPQFVASTGSTTNSSGNAGQANLQLRGLGRQRTLVLMDGRRLPPANSDSSVDINLIPAALIANVEVITGGASATYGSDAVAGVVNFIIKRDFEGLQFNAQYGISQEGDAVDYKLGLLMGGNFADDRGNAFMSFEYANREEVYLNERDWTFGASREASLPGGLAAFNAANAPSQAAIDAVFAGYGIAPGTVGRGSSFGFNDDGTIFATGAGVFNYRGSTDPNAYFNNGRQILSDGRSYRFLQLPLERQSFFSRATYDLTDDIEVFGQLLATQTVAATQLNPTPATGAYGSAVGANNPFLPADLRALIGSRADPNAPFTLNQLTAYLGPRRTTTTRETYQAMVGARGSLPIRDWTWDVMASHSRSSARSIQPNRYSESAQRNLLFAADGGASICSGGYNPFGGGELSTACRAYLERILVNTNEAEQNAVEFNTQGGLFDLPAGELRFAAGASYRDDFYSSRPDSLSILGDITLANAQAFEGSTSVREVYFEFLAPLLRDLPLIQELDLGLGSRFSDYDSVGGVHTYNVNFDWRMVDTLRLRGGYDRAVRAPNVGELFVPESIGAPIIGLAGNIGSGDPCDINGAYRKGANAAAVRTLCLANGVPNLVIDSFTYGQQSAPSWGGGNPNLKEEVADTFTVGAVWQPRLSSEIFSNLTLSLDYYNISLKDAVGEVPANLVLAYCFNSDGISNPTYDPNSYYCSLIKRDASGTLSQIVEELYNLGGYKTSGIDYQVDWRLNLDALGLDPKWGSLSFNLMGTYLLAFEIQNRPEDPFVDYVGTIGNRQVDTNAISRPEWKANLQTTWSIGDWNLGLRWRYIGAMDNAANVGTTGVAPGVGSTSYFDVTGRWALSERLDLWGTVTNVGNTEPPIYPSAGSTDLSTYDVIGRRFAVGIKAKF